MPVRPVHHRVCNPLFRSVGRALLRHRVLLPLRAHAATPSRVFDRSVPLLLQVRVNQYPHVRPALDRQVIAM